MTISLDSLFGGTKTDKPDQDIIGGLFSFGKSFVEKKANAELQRLENKLNDGLDVENRERGKIQAVQPQTIVDRFTRPVGITFDFIKRHALWFAAGTAGVIYLIKKL